jgi:probable rRNA maturation factor
MQCVLQESGSTVKTKKLPAFLKLKWLNRLEIHIQNDQQTAPIDEQSVLHWVKSFLTLKKVTCNEIAIYFVDKETICQLHEEHFDDPTPTDCISFPIDGEDCPADRHLGEVFVCPEVALEYVQENGGDLEKEIALYTIHGLLHLIGYDDIEEADRLEMRSQESHILADLFTPLSIT